MCSADSCFLKARPAAATRCLPVDSAVRCGMEATGRYQQVHVLIDLLTADGCGGGAAVTRRCATASDGVSSGYASKAQSYWECPAGPRETRGESCGSLSPGRSTAGESAGTCSPGECTGARETGAAPFEPIEPCKPVKGHGFGCSAHELAAARSMYVPHDTLSGSAHDKFCSRLGAAHNDPHPWALFWKHAPGAPDSTARGTPAPLSLTSALEPRDFTLEMLRASLLAAGVGSEGSPEAHPPRQLSVKQMTLDEDYLDNIAALIDATN